VSVIVNRTGLAKIASFRPSAEAATLNAMAAQAPLQTNASVESKTPPVTHTDTAYAANSGPGTSVANGTQRAAHGVKLARVRLKLTVTSVYKTHIKLISEVANVTRTLQARPVTCSPPIAITPATSAPGVELRTACTASKTLTWTKAHACVTTIGSTMAVVSMSVHVTPHVTVAPDQTVATVRCV
jgi:hypothetical protein